MRERALIRAWAVRAIGNQAKVAEKVDPAIERQLAVLGGDSSPDVQLQIAIAAVKVNQGNPAGLAELLNAKSLSP